MDKKKIEAAYKSAGSLRGAADKLGVSYEYVRGYLREYGIARNSPGRPHSKKKIKKSEKKN